MNFTWVLAATCGAVVSFTGCADSPSPAPSNQNDASPDQEGDEVCAVDPSACLDDAGMLSPLITQPQPGDCPAGVPSQNACDAGAPQLASAATVFTSRCGGCHKPGGLYPTIKLATTDDVAALAQNADRRTDVLTQIVGCRMPPACICPLNDTDRQTILQWLVCQ
jgi:hypothetical protein